MWGIKGVGEDADASVDDPVAKLGRDILGKKSDKSNSIDFWNFESIYLGFIMELWDLFRSWVTRICTVFKLSVSPVEIIRDVLKKYTQYPQTAMHGITSLPFFLYKN